jgi:hypothetical protein
MVQGVNNNMSPGLQGEAMGASAAMIVSGLEKELKGTSRINTDLHQQKIDLKELNQYVQKLTDASAIDRVKKNEGEKERGQKKEEEQRKRTITLGAKEITKPFDWTTISPANGIWEFLRRLESMILKELLKFVLQPNFEELLVIAREFNLASWNLEKINISPSGEILLSSQLSEKEKLVILLIDEYKVLEIGRLLEESWVKLAVINLRLFRVKTSLKELGMKPEILEEINLAAHRIAFLKLVALLKETHLKRVFSGSQKEFDQASGVIRFLTQKVLKIKVDIPAGSLNWIKERLGTLAKESARYKLELLRSLQTLSYEADREKNIKWLETTVARLS